MGHSTDHMQDPKPDTNIDAMALMQELRNLFVTLQKRMEFDEEKQWLRDHCQNAVLLSLLENMTTMMIHVLDTIGRLEPVNGSAVSKHMEVPKGTVSKITRRLLTNGLLIIELLPDNRKEILFRLTPLGLELFDLHQTLHQRIEIGVQNLYRKYNVDELRFVIDFLKDALESPWIEPDPAE